MDVTPAPFLFLRRQEPTLYPHTAPATAPQPLHPIVIPTEKPVLVLRHGGRNPEALPYITPRRVGSRTARSPSRCPRACGAPSPSTGEGLDGGGPRPILVPAKAGTHTLPTHCPGHSAPTSPPYRHSHRKNCPRAPTQGPESRGATLHHPTKPDC